MDENFIKNFFNCSSYETINLIKSYIPTRKYVNFNININETMDITVWIILMIITVFVYIILPKK